MKNNKHSIDSQIIVCDDCGTDENVKATLCPYSEEINNKKIEVFLCDDCYQERVWDI